MLKITWAKTMPTEQYSSRVGRDEEGNEYYEPANGETCSVTLRDGRSGYGWTAEEAYAKAKSYELTSEDKAKWELRQANKVLYTVIGYLRAYKDDPDFPGNDERKAGFCADLYNRILKTADEVGLEILE